MGIRKRFAMSLAARPDQSALGAFSQELRMTGVRRGRTNKSKDLLTYHVGAVYFAKAARVNDTTHTSHSCFERNRD